MPDFTAFVREHVARLALPPDRERKVVEEWAAQLEEAYDALRRGGLTGEEAWRELQRQVPDWSALGGELLDAEPFLLRVAQTDRGPLARGRGPALVRALRETLTSGLARDLRSAIRLLVKDRGFSAAIVLTLAVCLGANAAVFTVVHAVLLRPLPVPEPDRVIAVGDVYPTITPNDILSNDAPSYFDRLEAVTAFEAQAMFTFWYDTIRIDGVAEEVRGMRATPSLFRLLRVPPALGRTFTDEEGTAGADHTIVLSHGLWQRLYGGDPEVIGRTLRLGWTGRAYTIVGVMPRGFSFFDPGYDGHARTPGREAQFWIPLAFTPEQKSDAARTRYGYFHIGRLRPGATLEQAQAQLEALTARNVERFPQFRFAELGMYTAATPVQEALTRRIRGTLYLLWAGAAFVLLIGAINIANLSIARASARARDLAMHVALGAGRARLARRLIVEAMIPAAIGGAAGVAVGQGILRAMASKGLEDLPNAAGIGMDAPVIGWIAGASALVGLLTGLAPALTIRGGAVHQVLVEAGRAGTGGPAARLFRRGLVVAQVAVSVVLLIAATLLFTSFRHLLSVDAGFSAARVITATIFPPPSRYPDSSFVAALSDRLLERLRRIPGVRSAGITSNIALSGFESPATVSAARPSQGGEPEVVASVVAITPGYFETMETLLVRGRSVDGRDREGAPRVAIVDDRLAARLWPGADPIGQAIYRGDSGPYTVVGVVRQVRFESPAAKAESAGTAYFPHAQAPPIGRLRWIAIKASGEPAALMRGVRSAVAGIDPDLPLADVQTMGERTARSLASQHLAMTLAALFAIVALFLSLLGLYGVLAQVVARRTREFGIRMALGSTARGVFRLVLREGLTLIGAGLILGLAGALALGRALQGHLFGVRPTDPFVLGGVVVVTGCVAAAACLAPARRATRVDPVGVLSEP